MGKIYLLDCTLRDGGYVNNWKFGRGCIKEFPEKLVNAGVEIMELGFIRQEAYDPDRSVFTSAENLGRFQKNDMDKTVIYSAMIEGNESDRNFPLSRLGAPEETGIDLIRVCTWKRLMEEHIGYCKQIGELGYKLSVQPTAIDQYNEEEFLALIRLVNEIKPYAFYLVDTWGTQSAADICRYARLADEYLKPEIKLGYHGHNNKMQAIVCVDALLRMALERDVCIDASIMGMGRGPGNLQTEVLMDYLNRNYGKNYKVSNVISLGSKYIKDNYEKSPWGYSMYHFLSADRVLPQDFATYFKEQGYSLEDFLAFIDSLEPQEKIVFRRQQVEEKLQKLGIKK